MERCYRRVKKGLFTIGRVRKQNDGNVQGILMPGAGSALGDNGGGRNGCLAKEGEQVDPETGRWKGCKGSRRWGRGGREREIGRGRNSAANQTPWRMRAGAAGVGPRKRRGRGRWLCRDAVISRRGRDA